MKPFDSISNPREIRRKLGINQQEFWAKVGVTQSGGSRYENGRNMPRPVRELVRLVHIEHVDLSKIKRDDLEAGRRLKDHSPALYKKLKQGQQQRSKSSR